MAYKLLGMAVWKGGKLFLRHKYGSTYAPKPVVAGAGVLVVALLALAIFHRRDSDS